MTRRPKAVREGDVPPELLNIVGASAGLLIVAYGGYRWLAGSGHARPASEADVPLPTQPPEVEDRPEPEPEDDPDARRRAANVLAQDMLVNLLASLWLSNGDSSEREE